MLQHFPYTNNKLQCHLLQSHSSPGLLKLVKLGWSKGAYDCSFPNNVYFFILFTLEATCILLHYHNLFISLFLYPC